MKQDLVEADERPPMPLDNFNSSTFGRGGSETYWRYGYVVDGGKPYLLNEHCRTKDIAQKKARAAALGVRLELLRLGAPAVVSSWTQEWRVTTTVKYSDPEVVSVVS